MYYTAQSDLTLHDVGRYASVRTHRNITTLAQHLKQNANKEEVKDRLRAVTASPYLEIDEAAIEASIDLTARLLLMLELGCVRHGFSGLR